MCSCQPFVRKMFMSESRGCLFDQKAKKLFVSHHQSCVSWIPPVPEESECAAKVVLLSESLYERQTFNTG